MADSAQAEGCSLGTQRRVGIGAEQGVGRGREPRAPGLLTCAVDQESQEDEDPGHRAAEQRSASSVRRAPGSSRGRANTPALLPTSQRWGLGTPGSRWPSQTSLGL